MRASVTRSVEVTEAEARFLRAQVAVGDLNGAMIASAVDYASRTDRTVAAYAEATEDDGEPLWSGGDSSARPGAGLRSQLEALVRAYAEEATHHGNYADRGDGAEHWRSAGKSAIYDRCAKDIAALLADAGPEPASASQARRFAAEGGPSGA